MKKLLLQKHEKLSLAAESWSLAVHCGYIAVTEHWIDENRNLSSMNLTFRRFYAPHTKDSSCALLENVSHNRDLTKSLKSI